MYLGVEYGANNRLEHDTYLGNGPPQGLKVERIATSALIEI